MPSLKHLEKTAIEVLAILKTINDFEDASIAVIGGLALWKYVPTGRTTEDVDFVISLQNAPRGVKEKLLKLDNTPFSEKAQFFYYKSTTGQHVQIGIIPSWQCAFMPSNAVKLRDLPANAVPYASLADLVLLKMHACGLRAQRAKRRTDAKDAESLLSLAASEHPLTLERDQRAQVELCIADVVTYGDQNEAWWRKHLGLPAQS